MLHVVWKDVCTKITEVNLSTKILEINLFAFAYRLFHRKLIYLHLFTDYFMKIYLHSSAQNIVNVLIPLYSFILLVVVGVYRDLYIQYDMCCFLLTLQTEHGIYDWKCTFTVHGLCCVNFH